MKKTTVITSCLMLVGMMTVQAQELKPFRAAMANGGTPMTKAR